MKKGFYYLLLVFVVVALSCKSLQPQSPNIVTQTPADSFTNNDNISTPVTPNDGSPQPLETEPVTSWATYLEGTSENADTAVVRSIEKDAVGNIYALIARKENDSGNLWNLYLLKFGKNGAAEWQIPVVKETLSYSFLALDNQGNVYVSGDYFIENKAINPYRSETNWSAPLNPYRNDFGGIGNESAFIAKYSSDGALLWNTYVNGLNVGIITLDNDGNLYISGGGIGLNGILAKLGGDGVVQWSRELAASPGSGSNSNTHSIKIDDQGNIYISGEISDLAAGANFVTKFQSDGNEVWTSVLGGEGAVYFDLVDEMEVDYEGNVYVFGISSGSWGNPLSPFIGDSIGNGSYFAKLDRDGNLLWNTFLGYSAIISAIELDSNGNPSISGFSLSGWGNPKNAHSGNKDGFIAQFDRNGSLLWNTFIGGVGNERVTVFNIISDSEVYIAGISDAAFESPLLNGLLNNNGGKGGIFIVSTSMEGLR
jgi:hypothetical protein